MAAHLLRRPLSALALIAVALAAVLAVAANPATADPENEGGSKSLRAALESAARGHIEATQRLETSKKRQKELQATLAEAQTAVKALQGQVNQVAARSYRYGRFNEMSMLLNATSPSGMVSRIRGLDVMAQLDSRALTRYRTAVETSTRAKAAIDQEIKNQTKQVKVLANKKREAEIALGSVGGSAAGGFVNANSPLAKPAPRNSDGSWPTERCTVDDPTTSGCITPRLLHAYQQAQAAGFKRYTSCFSQRASGEHPQGKACDFSAASSGFQNSNASGGDKTYGDNLASFLVKNCSRLACTYVIWYRQIWMPNTGWRNYSASGGPSSTHTNHVHLSVL